MMRATLVIALGMSGCASSSPVANSCLAAEAAPAAGSELQSISFCAADALQAQAFFRRGGSGQFGVVYNHGKEIEELGYEASVAAGYDLKSFVNAIADAGFVAFAAIRPGRVGTFDDWNKMAIAGVRYLEQKAGIPSKHVFVIGFSKGGLLGFQNAVVDDGGLRGLLLMSPAAGSGDLGWQPYATKDRIAKLAIPIFSTLGGAEMGEIPTNVSKFRADMKALGKPVDVHDYPGKDHAWFHQVRDEYWKDVVAWLKAK